MNDINKEKTITAFWIANYVYFKTQNNKWYRAENASFITSEQEEIKDGTIIERLDEFTDNLGKIIAVDKI